jgi:hypothetical protein
MMQRLTNKCDPPIAARWGMVIPSSLLETQYRAGRGGNPSMEERLANAALSFTKNLSGAMPPPSPNRIRGRMVKKTGPTAAQLG